METIYQKALTFYILYNGVKVTEKTTARFNKTFSAMPDRLIEMAVERGFKA